MECAPVRPTLEGSSLDGEMAGAFRAEKELRTSVWAEDTSTQETEQAALVEETSASKEPTPGASSAEDQQQPTAAPAAVEQLPLLDDPFGPLGSIASPSPSSGEIIDDQLYHQHQRSGKRPSASSPLDGSETSKMPDQHQMLLQVREEEQVAVDASGDAERYQNSVLLLPTVTSGTLEGGGREEGRRRAEFSCRAAS